jgi:hypothetical protein
MSELRLLVFFACLLVILRVSLIRCWFIGYKYLSLHRQSTVYFTKTYTASPFIF